MWTPNFGHPILNFLAWVILLVVVIWVGVFVINLLRDLFGDDAPDPAAIVSLVPQHFKFRIG